MWITGSQILLVGLLHRTLPLDSSLQFTPQHSIQSHTKSRKVTPMPFDLHASVCLCTMVQCCFFHRDDYKITDYKRIRSTSKCFSTSLIITTLLPIKKIIRRHNFGWNKIVWDISVIVKKKHQRKTQHHCTINNCYW